MKLKNISGRKLDVGGHRVCANHLIEIPDDMNVDEFISRGLLEKCS